jgi:signal transduction histidine kinase
VTEPEPWGEDPHLDALLGEQGSQRFRTVFDGYPDGVGVLWAIRDDDGVIVDFEFGYGNPMIMRMFRLPRTQRGRYTLLEALPIMRDNGQFDAYVRVCDTGEALSDEIVFDTPFGDGYIQSTILRRTAKLGDGLIVFVADVTAQRRMESELRGYADMVAHDLREPIIGIAHLVTLLERRAGQPPSAEVLALLRASTERARELIDGVLDYARARASCSASGSRSTASWATSPRTCGRAWTRPARRSTSARCRRSTAIRASCAGCCRTSSATPSSSAATHRRGSRSRR